ncbi:MAG: hypothetical protein IJ072_06600 [Oscillospiraceae bacterium]|nr:hypothetical protein [Oscillospiraceae bacterium]
MRTLALMMILALALTSCGARAEDEAKMIQQEISQSAIEAKLDVTADDGERVYDFSMEYSGDADGGTITVTAPECVKGLTATLTAGSCVLEYDGVEFDIGELAPRISPVSVMEILSSQWREGLIQSVSAEKLAGEDTVCLTSAYNEEINQSTWFSRNTHLPVKAEIYRNGQMILLVSFTDVILT